MKEFVTVDDVYYVDLGNEIPVRSQDFIDECPRTADALASILNLASSAASVKMQVHAVVKDIAFSASITVVRHPAPEFTISARLSGMSGFVHVGLSDTYKNKIQVNTAADVVAAVNKSFSVLQSKHANMFESKTLPNGTKVQTTTWQQPSEKIVKAASRDERSAVEQLALKRHRQYVGKTVKVKRLSGYINGDGQDVQLKTPIRVRILDTERGSVLHWTDDRHLDPHWDVEPVDGIPSDQPQLESCYIHAPSYVLDETETSDSGDLMTSKKNSSTGMLEKGAVVCLVPPGENDYGHSKVGSTITQTDKDGVATTYKIVKKDNTGMWGEVLYSEDSDDVAFNKDPSSNPQRLMSSRASIRAALDDIADELEQRGDVALATMADLAIAADDMPVDMGDEPPADMPPADDVPLSDEPPEIDHEPDLPMGDVPSEPPAPVELTLGQQVGQLADKIDSISNTALDPIVSALKETALLFAQLQPKISAANLPPDQLELFTKALEFHEKEVKAVTNLKQTFDFDQLTELRQLAASIDGGDAAPAAQ